MHNGSGNDTALTARNTGSDSPEWWLSHAGHPAPERRNIQQILQKIHAGVIYVFRDLRQQMLQVFVDLQLVGVGGLYQAVDNRTGFGTVDGINDMPVGSANGERPDGSLRCGIVDRDVAILQEHFEVLLLVNTVV